MERKIRQASDILAELRAGVEELYEIKMRSATIPVRVLSASEINRCRQEAKKVMMLDKGDETDMNFEIEKNILRLASKVPYDSAPLLSDKVLDALTIDEINMLYNEYMIVMQRVNPSIEQITPAEFRELVDALKKNIVNSKELSLRQLRAICTAFQDLIQRDNP